LIKNHQQYPVWWFIPIIPTTPEAETGRSGFEVSLTKLAIPYKIQNRGAGSMFKW
jgi:hypothetical protein